MTRREASDVPERAYRAAEGALTSWPVLTDEAMFDAIDAAAPIIEAAVLVRLATAPTLPTPASLLRRAYALDGEGTCHAVQIAQHRGTPIISASHRTPEGARLLPGGSGTVSGRPRTPEEGA